jgi:hypothetical protein
MKKWQKVRRVREEREHARIAVFIRARMRTANSEVRVFVRNLSCGGAQVDTNEPAHAGDAVRLHCDDLVADAIVAWADSKRLGLRFLEPIEEGLLAPYIRKRAA